jgi:hypothetical protein
MIFGNMNFMYSLSSEIISAGKGLEFQEKSLTRYQSGMKNA